jgi:hypothetical protein
MLRALVFAVSDCGFVPRAASGREDSAEVRFYKIRDIIRTSKYGVHDISRAGLDTTTRLARFNMPLELGVFLGALHFGGEPHTQKNALILDRERYRYQKFCSDIAGQDIRAHNGSPASAITAIRNWLHTTPETEGVIIPSGSFLVRRYEAFKAQLPSQCTGVNLDPSELSFLDVHVLVVGWLKKNPIPR